ncbi:MAG: hypothetical protein HYW24_02345 [Candidatus Aenigmarchaeota archaeon]|nr:hypothetical protein [Candidatus Aenigmarchaeota archaeon]
MVLDWFKRLIKKQTSGQALDSINQTNKQADKQTNTQTSEYSSLEFDKESVQLGLAAGYTGRSIHDINTTLNRIETLMPSKDWLLIQFEEHFHRHEENEQRRLEIVLKALNSLHLLSSQAPEPLKTKMLDQIKVVETNLELSRRMTELVQLVKYSGEATYKDLAAKMGITPSAFRSMLSLAMQRTNELEKIIRGNKKYLKYRNSSTASSVQTDTNNEQNQSNEQAST